MAYRATVNLADNIGIAEDDDSPHRIVCRRDEGGQWHPMFAVDKSTDERVELPSCFSPRREIIEALRNAWNVAYFTDATPDEIKAAQTPDEIMYPISRDDLEFVANELASRAQVRETFPGLWVMQGKDPHAEIKRLRALAAHMRFTALTKASV